MDFMDDAVKELKLEKLPVGIPSFSSLRQQKMIYVDKTKLICDLAENYGYYFITRPHRFGKSLLLSTLESLFSRGLVDFDGLDAKNSWSDGCYKVLRLDFSKYSPFEKVEEFQKKFYDSLEIYMAANPAPRYSLALDKANSTISRFDSYLDLHEDGSIVLLVDEYDNPLNRCLDKVELFHKVQLVLKNFYDIVKANAGKFRFVFITGMLHHRNTGIFANFNISQDLSLDPNYATLLGFTLDELKLFFAPFIEHAATVLHLSYDACIEKMREHYGGFCFDEQALTQVFAPWSVLNFLKAPENGFKNYWNALSGSTSVLARYLNSHSLKHPAEYGQDHEIIVGDFASCQPLYQLDDLSFLTQAGILGITHLTIKSKSFTKFVCVNYPNIEISEAMAKLY